MKKEQADNQESQPSIEMRAWKKNKKNKIPPQQQQQTHFQEPQLIELRAANLQQNGQHSPNMVSGTKVMPTASWQLAPDDDEFSMKSSDILEAVQQGLDSRSVNNSEKDDSLDDLDKESLQSIDSDIFSEISYNSDLAIGYDQDGLEMLGDLRYTAEDFTFGSQDAQQDWRTGAIYYLLSGEGGGGEGGGGKGGGGKGASVRAAAETDEGTEGVRPKARRNSKWTAEEDALLTRLHEENPEWQNKQFASQIPNRNPTQCHNRWWDKVNPALRWSEWSAEEDALLLEGRAKGMSWSKIVKGYPCLNNRAYVAAKNRWHKLENDAKKVKKKAKKKKKVTT